ncbi:glycosyltransferase family A protein [Microlunatus sp. Gsoil 973]|uniref:glycosyltransferase family 2 protein n=1 Tax=Microlunatus sp. Gsoil 973 TaxID=2672569 RepID=UPI0018A87953|nr:glycosyltransferase family A protein [Microlunatus sp. Gsoil 973]
MGLNLPAWPRFPASLGVRRRPRVSVVVPVFNAMPYLTELLSSLDDQGLSPAQLQVILVDDGSTDGSPAVLDDFGRDRPNVIVLHQVNSGWPGQPRNKGLEHATGRWVFFADADDYFASGALADLADYGDRQRTQIVLPRVNRFGNRSAGRRLVKTKDRVSKEVAFRSFTPHKLVRRDLIMKNGVRFPEGKVRLEDGIFFSRCFLLTDRISALADREYYMMRGRTDGGNISRQPKDPAGYVSSVERIVQTTNELCDDPGLRSRLIAIVLHRKCLKLYAGGFARLSDDLQQRWLTEHRQLLTRYMTAEIRAELAPIDQDRLALVLTGDRSRILAHIRDNRVRPAGRTTALEL